MDFLRALPVELWREILLQTPAPWIYGVDQHSDVLFASKSHLMNDYTIKKTQCERAALLLICKALQPLAEELLFAEVSLETKKAARIFSWTAESGGDQRKGHWTKRIAIATSRLDPMRTGIETGSRRSWDQILQRIESACPRVITVHLFEGGDNERKLILPAQMLGRLTSLTLDGGALYPLDVLNICLYGPSLRYLRIGQTGTLDVWPLMSFENVRTLSAWSHLLSAAKDFRSNVTFPRLEWLCLRSSREDGPQDAVHFILRHRLTLIGMEISTTRLQMVEISIASTVCQLAPSFMRACPNLQTIILPLTTTKLYEESLVDSLQILVTLVIKMDQQYEAYHVTRFREYFSRERFPTLAKIELVYTRAPQKFNEDDISCFSDEDGFLDWRLNRAGGGDAQAEGDLGSESSPYTVSDSVGQGNEGSGDGDRDEVRDESRKNCNRQESDSNASIVDERDEEEPSGGGYDDMFLTEDPHLHLWRSSFPHATVEIRHAPFD